MGYVLHVVPDSVLNTRKALVGSTKDVRGRTEYFQTRGVEYREYVSLERSDARLAADLRAADLSGCGAVFIEYETYIESLRYLRDAHPHIVRIVRSFSANLLHHLDNLIGRTTMKDGPGAAAAVNEGLVRFQQDSLCAQLADVILPITEWEAHHYWGQLTASEHVIVAPYFLPRAYEVASPGGDPRKLCVCFMGANHQVTPLLHDLARNAIDLVNASGEALADWEFHLTGTIKPEGVLGALGRFRPTGFLPSPFELLREARVVAIISDLGMGFKTKIVEAIMAGCWVIVTHDVWARLPDAVRPWCKAIHADSPEEFEQAIRQCEAPPPPGSPNEQLREAAFRAYDAVFARHDLGPGGRDRAVPQRGAINA